MASTQGKNSPNLDWVAWNVAAYKGQTAHIEVTDQRTEDWGHLLVDHIVFSDAAAAPWNQNTSANLIVDGQVVRTATGQNGPGLDWASWDLSDLQGDRRRSNSSTGRSPTGPSHRGLLHAGCPTGAVRGAAGPLD